MTRYIDAENVKNKIIKYHAGLRPRYITRLDDALISDICDIIDEENQADVQPVMHAHWTIKELHYPKHLVRLHTCSSCKGQSHRNYKFCPNCGAKMDEK